MNDTENCAVIHGLLGILWILPSQNTVLFR